MPRRTSQLPRDTARACLTDLCVKRNSGTVPTVLKQQNARQRTRCLPHCCKMRGRMKRDMADTGRFKRYARPAGHCSASSLTKVRKLQRRAAHIYDIHENFMTLSRSTVQHFLSGHPLSWCYIVEFMVYCING